MITKVATALHLHYQVQIVSVLECLHHVHYERVLELCEDLSLINH